MKPKATCSIAVTVTTLTVIVATTLHSTSQQLWNPQVARALKVTTRLIHGRVIDPVQLARNTRTEVRAMQTPSTFGAPGDLLTQTLTRRSGWFATPNLTPAALNLSPRLNQPSPPKSSQPLQSLQFDLTIPNSPSSAAFQRVPLQTAHYQLASQELSTLLQPSSTANDEPLIFSYP
jgi:hypothetical protein